VSGSVHQGYKAFATCGPNLTFHHSLELGKVMHERCWRWLAKDHPYQKNQNPIHFNGKEELRSRPKLVITTNTLRSAIEDEAWLGVKNTPRSKGDPLKVNGIKHCTTLYD